MTLDVESQMEGLKVVLRPVEDLIPYAMNARTHSDAQVAQIAASIREFGFNNPVLTDGHNGIVAGHGRVLASRKLGLKRVPTIDLGHLDDTRKRAYILADNQLALNAGWADYNIKITVHGFGGVTMWNPSAGRNLRRPAAGCLIPIDRSDRS